MPLPKTATIAARATEVYCEVWSVILQQFCQMAPIRTNDLKELCQLLPYLRQLLTCCACAGLLDNAMVSLACGHCYCFECQFREPLLKIHCRQCRGRTGLVSEKQLQLVVNCYKSMCHILGEELRKDPLALGSAVRSEPNNLESVLHSKEETDSLPSESKSKDEERVDLKIPDKVSVVDSGSTIDPITEIVREVEKGTKVSRAIFVIRPPSKYINAKVSIALKKEPIVNTSATSVETTRIPSPLTSKGEMEDCSLVKCCQNVVMNNGIKQGIDDKDLNSRSVRVVKRRRMRKKVHKTLTIKATAGTCISARPNMTTHPIMSTQKLNSYQRHSNAKRRKKKALTVASATPLLSLEMGETEMKASGSIVEIDMDNSECLQNHSIVPTSSHLAEMRRKSIHGQVRVKDLGVCVSCLDERYLNLTPDTITLLPQEQILHRLNDALAAAPSSRNTERSTFTPGQWKKATRKRVWGPFCRSVTVKRNGDDIAKMILLQTNAAKVRRRVRQKLKPAAKEGSMHPPLAITSPPLPIPPIPMQPVTSGDIPILEHIPILSGDGRNHVTDVDINWTEFSNLFESTDEEVVPALSTLGCYPPPHHLFQPPPLPSHDSELGPVLYGEFDSHALMHHRPCLQPPRPLPRPSHLPPLTHHHHSPHPPMMPFSPMMGPDNYFPPMNPGGIRPDLGGYSSPVTSMRAFSAGLGPEGVYHQRSPNHHHPGGGGFPFPNSGGGFSPVGRGGFPRGTPPTLMMVPKKKSNHSPMSDMVGKMKLKSPSTPTKNLLTTPAAQNKKQRRSPGYSEAGWRCRCGTNNVMFPEKVCAKGKCPCYSKGIACKNCLCRYCHNPFGPREQTGATSPVVTEVSSQ